MQKDPRFDVTFWGTRGSIPAPLVAVDVQQKVRDAHEMLTERPEVYSDFSRLPFHVYGTYGGNTTCVQVVCGKRLIILDMGSGLRGLGNALIPQMFANAAQNDGVGLDVTFLLSHVHWDHVQGFPFFGPLHVNKNEVKNTFRFFGGVEWQGPVELVLRGQMDPPSFPVSFQEIEMIAYKMKYETVYNMCTFVASDGLGNSIEVECRKLNHPQETYGYRIVYGGKVLAWTTDHEPYDPMYPDPNLLYLADGADVWITDNQYTCQQYNADNPGMSKRGWGHSYTGANVQAAMSAGVRQMVFTHHDPSSSDRHIYDMVVHGRELLQGSGITVEAAYEGMTISLS